MKENTESKLFMSINIYESGRIQVVDGEGQRLDPMSPEKLGRTLAGREFSGSEICTILTSNPCGWVCVGGNWYWRHW